MDDAVFSTPCPAKYGSLTVLTHYIPVRKRWLPLLPTSLRLAFPSLGLRRQQIGSRQSGEEFWVFDATAGGYPARSEHE